MDPCVWVRFDSDGVSVAVLLVQVDDLLGWCANIDALSVDLRSMGFKVGKLVCLEKPGDTVGFFGARLTMTDVGLTLDMYEYISDRMAQPTHQRPVHVPMSPHNADDDEASELLVGPMVSDYRSMTGSIGWVSHTVDPRLAYTSNYC